MKTKKACTSNPNTVQVLSHATVGKAHQEGGLDMDVPPARQLKLPVSRSPLGQILPLNVQRVTGNQVHKRVAS